MKKSFLKKLFAVVSAISIVFQSLTPYALLLPQVASAQEIVQEQTSTDISTTESTPVVEVVTPAEEITPTEEVTPTPESNSADATPIPTEDLVTPTDTPVDNLSPPSSEPSASQVQGDSTSVTLESNPTDTISTPNDPVSLMSTGNEELNLVILENISAPSLDLQAVNTYGSASLTTDKPDYAPTDTALITGSNLIPNTTYILRVWSDDEPPTSTTIEVTSDENGVFAYAYQLDGTYRPNYSAELKDSEGNVVASTTFTDAATGTLFPNGQGTYTSWTGDEDDIDETGTPDCEDNDTDGDDNIAESNTGDRESVLIDLSSLSNGSTITSVDVTVTYRNGNSGSADNGTFQTFTRLNGTNLDSGTNLVATNDTCTSGTQTINVADTVKSGATTLEVGVLKTITDTSEVWVGTVRAVVTYTAPASPYTFTNDSAGANDEPGQKDLTLFGKNLSATNPLDIVWNWDITSLSGNNTADGCALFDTDSDGNANYALCVTWGGNQVQQAGSPTLYSCNDTRVDRCAGSSLVASPTSTCNVTNTADDPFGAGDSYPNDTRASCLIPLSDVGGVNANLLDVCSYPSTQPNSDPSDCVVVVSNKGNLTIVKNVTPDDATTNWNFAATGATSFNTSISGDGTSGINSVDLGTYSIVETAGANTNLSNYSTVWSCTKNGSAYLSGSGTTASNLIIGSSQGAEDSIVCTFTNTRINNGSITIVKDAVPNDEQDFVFTTGAGLSEFTLDDNGNNSDGTSNTRVFSNLASGTYSVAETVPTGWTQTSATCSDQSPVSAISLSAGENVTCTFTNTKKPKLTIVKVTNPTSDTGKFNLSINSTQYATDVSNGGTSNAQFANAGSNTFAEAAGTSTSLSNYTSVVSGTGCSGTATAGTITLAAGDNKTCTITNTRNTGSITVNKNVDNNNDGDVTDQGDVQGATDWTWDIASGEQNIATGQSRNLVTGNYTITEDVKTNYHIVGWTCTNQTNGSTNSIPVNLSSNGQSITCTITNARNTGTIELKKVWSGTGGQTTLNIGTSAGDDDIDFQQTGANGNIPLTTDSNTVGTGTYYLSEIGGLTNYTPSALVCYNDINNNGTNDSEPSVSVGASDSVAVTTNQHVICTYTNTRNTGTIIVKKVMVGGTDTFTYTGTANGSISTNNGTIQATVDTGAYSSVEGAKTGWDLTSIVCDDNNSTGNVENRTANFNAESGETVTCTFTNTKKPTLSIYKVCEPAGDTGLFNLRIDGVNQTTDTICGGWTNGAIEVTVGSHTVSETGGSGTNLGTYSSVISGDCASDGSVTLAAGENKSCTITNTKLGNVTVVKYHDHNINGVRDSGDEVLGDTGAGAAVEATRWEIHLSQMSQFTGAQVTGQVTFSDLLPNSFTLSEQIKTNWFQSNISCGEETGIDNDNSHPVTLAAGQNLTCEIGNYQKGNVIVVKYNDEDGDGRLVGENPVLSGWTINLEEDSEVTGGNGTVEFNNLVPGAYTLGEDLQNGWEQTDISCPENRTSNNENGTIDVVVESGQTVFCQILNHQLDPIFTISKTNDAEGDKSPNDNVGYTITLTLDEEGGPVENLKVTDLLPNGFVYNSGSWQVFLNGNPIVVEEPTYASPGTWTLGSANPGDIFTLKYTAKIDGSQATGTYYDNAWGQGTPIGDSSSLILAQAVNPGQLDSTFVGTQVSVVNGAKPGVDYKATSTQDVLGASTFLPATGENTLWVIIASLLSISGFGILITGLRLRRKYAKN